MSYVSGHPVEHVAQRPQDIRNHVATRLIALFLREVFEFKLVQTDANFANYLFDPGTARIALLDFGATREIDPAVAERCRALLAAGLAGDRDGLKIAAGHPGILTPDQPRRVHARILAVLEDVFTALTEGEAFDFGTSDLARRMRDQGIALAADGCIPAPLPRGVLHIQRKIGGVFLLATRLRARDPIQSLLADCLAPPARIAHPDGERSPLGVPVDRPAYLAEAVRTGAMTRPAGFVPPALDRKLWSPGPRRRTA